MRKKSILLDLAVLIISMFCLFPSVTASQSFRLMVVVSSLYALNKCINKVVSYNNTPIFKIIIVFIISFIISYIVGIKYSINFYIHFTLAITLIIIYEYYKLRGLQSMRYIVYALLGLLVIGNLQTILVLFSNSGYARALSKNQETYEVIGLSGGYGLVYSSLLAFMSITIFVKKRKGKDKLFNSLVLVVFGSSLFLVLKSGFFLALILLLLGGLMLIVGIDKKRILRSAIIFVFAFIAISFFQSSISNYLMTQSVGTEYEEKVMQLLEDKETASGEFTERRNRYTRDLYLMYEYPVIGCWQFRLVGKHSFVLDNLAQFGLFFGGIFIYSIFYVPMRIIRISEGYAFTQATVFALVLFVFLLLNSFAIAILPIVFIIFPYTNHLLRQN